MGAARISRSGWSDEWLAHYQAQQQARVQPVAATPPPFELRPPPAPYRANRHEEEELQSAIVKLWRPLLVPGARLLATNGELPGGVEQIPRAARRKKMGYWRGTSDLLARRRGALLWLECKISPNKPTQEQDDFGTWAIDECGDGWCVVTSVVDAGSALRAWGMVRG